LTRIEGNSPLGYTESLLTSVWKDGALMRTTPEQAFFVKCDRTTMTQDDIDNGRLIILIGVAPIKPAEFVIIRIAQWTGNLKASGYIPLRQQDNERKITGR
jgi:phage tail sheath protein FI